MNVMWYVGKFDEATWQLFAGLGITAAFMRENQRGMAGVEQHITYKKELYPGDVVGIYSRVLEVKQKSIRVEHVMKNEASGEVSATMVLVAVHIDTVKRKGIMFPAEIRTKAEALL
jgi:acyl-CoA thioester hydrolase